MTPTSLRFDRFELFPHDRRLLADGTHVALGGRAFELLVVLAERPGQLVTKAELLDRVWPGLVVEENNIAAQVVALRKVLGGDMISTVPGLGYRFVATPRVGATAMSTSAVAVHAAAQAPAAPLRPAAAEPQLFGRDDELARLTEALRERGCITLVGPAGVGKTALAQTLAAAWAGRKVWVDLAVLADGPQVLPALCRALELTPPERDVATTLARALGDECLLVLDNAEHLIDAVAALVALLLPAASGAHLLVTSQLPLGVPGEQLAHIAPLAVAPPATPDVLALQVGAIALLVDRVARADPRFRIDPGAVPLLRDICTRLDGLPLALEMAAARVPLLGLKGVRDALDERFALLTRGSRVASGRHKTLQAALDWSHGLLSDEEQRLFRALGVFAGGFTLELAVAVAVAVAVAAQPDAERWDIIDRLSVLIERSLVVSDHQDPPRYRLLETMRVYALRALAASADEGRVRVGLATALEGLCRRWRMEEQPERKAELYALAGAELVNVGEALSWAWRHDPALALALAVAAARAATFTPWLPQAFHWVADCEPLLDGRLDIALQAAWWNEFARQQLLHRKPGATEAARRACGLYRGIGDTRELFWSCVALVRSIDEASAELDAAAAEVRALIDQHPEWPGTFHTIALGTQAHACNVRGDHSGALAVRLAELDMAQRTKSLNGAEVAESNVASCLIRLGRFQEAFDRMQTLLPRLDAANVGNQAYTRLYLTESLIALGRLDEARAGAAQALAYCRKAGAAHIANLMALLVARQGRQRSAARLLGHARHCYAAMGVRIEKGDLVLFERAETIVGAALDAASVQHLMHEGEGLDSAAADALLFADHDGA